MKRIVVNSTIHAEVDWQSYHGTLLMGGVTLAYEVCFTVSIVELHKYLDPNLVRPTINEVRETTGTLTLRKGGVAIAITDEEHSFFIRLIGGLATSLVHDAIEQLSGSSGDVVNGAGMTEAMMVPPQVIEFLSNPKFGCQFDN